MKKNCNIIKDLLPLYVDDICSEESKKLVEEHLKSCNNCKKYLKELKFNIKETKINDVNAFKKFAKMINFKLIKKIISITFLILMIIIGLFYFFFYFEFTQDYDKNMYLIISEYDDAPYYQEYNIDPEFELRLFTQIHGLDYSTLVSYEENGESTHIIFITNKYTLNEHLETKIGDLLPKYSVGNRYGNIRYKYNEVDLKNEKVKVYYTTENLKKIEKANKKELEKIIKESKLLFSTDKATSTINCTLDNKDYSYSLTYYSVNKQIIDSSNDASMPDELLWNIQSIKGDYKSIWFEPDRLDEVFNKTNNYMKKNGGSCTITNN